MIRWPRGACARHTARIAQREHADHVRECVICAEHVAVRTGADPTSAARLPRFIVTGGLARVAFAVCRRIQLTCSQTGGPSAASGKRSGPPGGSALVGRARPAPQPGISHSSRQKEIAPAPPPSGQPPVRRPVRSATPSRCTVFRSRRAFHVRRAVSSGLVRQPPPRGSADRKNWSTLRHERQTIDARRARRACGGSPPCFAPRPRHRYAPERTDASSFLPEALV
jgi:hypothetical protein